MSFTYRAGAANTPEVRAAFTRALDDMKWEAGGSGMVTFIVNKVTFLAKINGDDVTIGVCEYHELDVFKFPGAPTVMVPGFKDPDA